MIQGYFEISCDQCLQSSHCVSGPKHTAIIEFISDGWILRDGKDFCNKECYEKFLNVHQTKDLKDEE